METVCVFLERAQLFFAGAPQCDLGLSGGIRREEVAAGGETQKLTRVFPNAPTSVKGADEGQLV